jgi:putative ABC transport system permease protein
MNQEAERPVAISLRLYHALANAFPQEFKNAYGDELLVTAENAVEDIWRRYGVAGLVRLLADIAVRVPIEHLAEVRRDIRYGLRMLLRSPGFTAVSLISLTLGICIATCADSEMNGMIFRNVPGTSDPDELVSLELPVSYPNYKRYRELRDVFSSAAAYVAPVPFGVSLDGRTDRIWGHLVSPSYFSTLGVRPVLGRAFDPQDEQPGSACTVVTSHRFWEERLGADRSAIGKTLRLNGQPCTIVGVGPERFLGASPSLLVSDLWVPVSVGSRVAPELADNALERRDLTMFQMVARMKAGVAQERAEAELDAVARQLERDNGEAPDRDKERRVLLVPGGKVLPIRKQDRPLFTEFFMILAGLVVLIASANVANMMVARSADRRREIAVRLALGASRIRLVRQLLTESMLVALGAGILGFVLSVWLMHLLSQLRMPLPNPVTYDLNVDARAFLFAIVITALTGFGFGLLPALQATRRDLSPALKEGGTVVVRRLRRASLRNLLLLSQVAGSLMLLLLVGVLALGIQTTLGMQKGFNPRDLYLISLDPVRDGHSGKEAVDFLHKLLDRVQGLPSVTAAALTETVPVTIGGGPGVRFSTPVARAENSQAINWAERYVVGKDYFHTAGIPILSGHGFGKEDEAEGATAVIVSEELVRRYWKGENPLGRRIELSNDEISRGSGPMPANIDYRPQVLGKSPQMFEVIGVAADVTNDLVVQKEHPAIYFPLHPVDYTQPSLRGMTLIVRSVPGADVIEAVRREISTIDSSLTPFNSRSMMDQIGEFMSPLRAAAWTYACIGAFGLVLASVGLAGVTAYSVTQRRHEIGIRMALGAHAAQVLGLIMKEGIVLVVIGTIIGLSGAWVGMSLLSSLFSTVATVGKSDPALVLGAPFLLASLALAACYIPARSSMRIDPALALRHE